MSHSKIKIWIHAIIRTKNRNALIKPEIERTIHKLIKKQLIEQNCPEFRN